VAACHDELPLNDVNALLTRVEASDPSLPVLDICGNAQLSWLSPTQRVHSFERLAKGHGLKSLMLDSLGLDVLIAPALAAAVRSHAALETLSIERNGLNEVALAQIAEAYAGHQSLSTVSVSNQCNQELLTQPALIALISAMERRPTPPQAVRCGVLPPK